MDFVRLKFGRRTSGGSSADHPQIIRRSSADGLQLMCRRSPLTSFIGSGRFGIMTMLINVHSTGGICGGDLADVNSTGQPDKSMTQRLEMRQNLSRGPTCRSPVVVPMKEVKGDRLHMSCSPSADERRMICG
ncbi:hypothetical protein B0H13DRAFT_1882682 [Mycena leptocephala]|nr:hypothetical protein B0H13DRAFT_1882682 [Mycena leptocephala]